MKVMFHWHIFCKFHLNKKFDCVPISCILKELNTLTMPDDNKPTPYRKHDSLTELNFHSAQGAC